MKVQNKINILGTEYEILVQKANENPKLKDAYGLCEYYSKKIVLSEIEDNVMLSLQKAVYRVIVIMQSVKNL